MNSGKSNPSVVPPGSTVWKPRWFLSLNVGATLFADTEQEAVDLVNKWLENPPDGLHPSKPDIDLLRDEE